MNYFELIFILMSYVNDWIWLHIPCPVYECPNKSSNQSYYWVHRNCPGDFNSFMQINSAGYIRCGNGKCLQIGPLINWRFDCNCNHGFKKITNLIRLTEILMVMSQATQDQNFIARLMGSVSEMFLNQKE